jgi:hypothetical protein
VVVPVVLKKAVLPEPLATLFPLQFEAPLQELVVPAAADLVPLWANTRAGLASPAKIASATTGNGARRIRSGARLVPMPIMIVASRKDTVIVRSKANCQSLYSRPA